MKVQNLLKKYKITPDPLKDQFFLVDEEVIKKIVDLADLDKNDVVLEIGAGVGKLTGELAKKAGKVITIEIDERFKPLLADSPKNVELHFEDARNFFQLNGKFWKKKEYNKVIANLPFSLCEPFLHNLTFLQYDKVILLVPQKFADKIEDNPIFGSFFKAEEKLKVNREKFYPIPKTNSVVINLIKLPDTIKTKNLSLFLRQFIYKDENVKVKNSLREGLIKYVYLTTGGRLTKNEAKEIVAKC